MYNLSRWFRYRSLRPEHFVAGAAEVVRQKLRDGRIVLDQQDALLLSAHTPPPALGASTGR